MKRCLLAGMASAVLTCAGGAPIAAKTPVKAPASYVGTPADFMEISQLFSNYNYLIDNGDGLGWADLFSEDGVFRDPGICAIGRDALINVVGRNPREGGDQDHFHMPSLGPIKYLDRNHAMIHSTVIVVRETGFGKQPGGILVTGSYDDRLERVAGQWRFVYRWVHRPSNAPDVPCARAFPSANPASSGEKAVP